MAVTALADRLEGVWPVVGTPLDGHHEVDRDALARIVVRLLDAGTDGLWTLGAGGELALLDETARRTVVVEVVDTTNGRVPVVVGVSHDSSQQTISRARQAKADGADGVHVLEPSAYRLSSRELTRYFLDVAEASPLPVTIYHHADRWPIDPADPAAFDAAYRAIATHPNIVGMKDATRDFRSFQRLVFELATPSFRILTSAGRLLLVSLVVGGSGGAFHEAAVAPRQFVALLNAHRAGETATALEHQRRVIRLGDAMAAVDPASAKSALALLGVCAPTMVPPLEAVDGPALERLRSSLRALGLLGIISNDENRPEA